MRRPHFIAFILLLIAAPASMAQEAGPTVKPVSANLQGDYLGQEPPGLKPVLFGPEVISTLLYQERDMAFTPDLKELYFTRDEKILVMKQSELGWSEPVPAPFSTDDREAEPYVTLAGDRLYYVTRRPVEDSSEAGIFHIWFVDRVDSGWGEPQVFGNRRDYYVSITTYGEMYFTDANNDLLSGRLVDGEITDIRKLSDSVNTARPEYNSFVAPDGSFIIFTSFGWGPGYGGGDLFISYRKEDGSWTQPRNMGGGINTNGHDYCPSLSPDGKYLFYTSSARGTEDVYWVDAGIIERLKNEDLNTADMLFNVVLLNDAEVGKFKYAQLEEQFGECCVFDGRLLVAAGDRLMNEGRVKDAVTMMRMGADLHPETMTIGQRLKLAILEDDEELFDDVARQLRDARSTLGGPQEIQINGVGYRLLFWRNIPGAIKAFELNVELFPESFNVYDSYAEALMYNGDTTGSITNYEKSLELNPDNNNAVEKLKRLKGE